MGRSAKLDLAHDGCVTGGHMADADVRLVVFLRSIFAGLSIIALAMIERRRLSFDWRPCMTAAGIWRATWRWCTRHFVV